MMLVNDPEAVKSRRRLMCECHAKLAVPLPHACTSVDVPIVAENVHLGGLVTMSQKHARETAHRHSSAMAALCKVRKPVLSRCDVPRTVRAECMRALTMSRHAHNAGTWGTLTSAEEARFHHGVMCLCRPLVHADARQSWTDAQVIHELALPSPKAVLFSARMRFIRRYWKVAPATTRALVQWAACAANSWMQAVQHDMSFMHRCVDQLESMPCPYASTCVWFELAVGHGSAWLNYVSMAASRINDDCIAAEPMPSDSIPCEQCDRTFASASGLRAHLFRVHGVRSQAAAFADSSGLRRACGKMLHNRARLLAHLNRDSAFCLPWYRQHVEPMNAEQMAEADCMAARLKRDAKRLGQCFKHAALPCCSVP